MILPHIDDDLVRRLVDAQFPQWSGRPLRRFEPAGSDHIIYRLGDDLSVRLPRHQGAVDQADKEFTWLPLLAPLLPLAIPEPVAVGRPGFGYPWPWAVTRWLDGEPATVETSGDSGETARVLADFLLCLQRVGQDGELPIDRSPDLPERDERTRAAIEVTAGTFDPGAMLATWEAALSAPAWDRAPVWYHGDFHTGNLLTSAGEISAVIDFGGLGVGDPARDLMMAFTLLSESPRAVFRERLGVDDATWQRGRGWALTGGLLAYTAYADTNPVIAAQTTRQIRAALREN